MFEKIFLYFVLKYRGEGGLFVATEIVEPKLYDIVD